MNDYNIDSGARVPSAKELAETYGPYLTKTKTQSRPEKGEGTFRHNTDPKALETAQRQWDTAAAYEKGLDDWVAENKAKREAEEQRKRDEFEAARKAKTSAERVDLEAKLRRTFLMQPGVDENDWERLKGQYIDNHLITQAGAADEAARAASTRMYRSSF